MQISSIFGMPKNYIKHILLLTFSCFALASFGQQKKSSYINEFEKVKSNLYNQKLIKLSAIVPNKNWNEYKGAPMETPDSIFIFNNAPLSLSFPTNSTKITNDYLIIYFSQKTAKCPTLFSLFNYYKPTIDSALLNNGLPKELNLLPAVCSAFNPTSNNGIGGFGFWHLNHPQAIKYGLIVNDYVDERRDFKKSTKAATGYLKDLHTKYNNWELTLAAYSSGVVTINNLLNRHNASSYKQIATYLPEQTKGFVEAFIALTYVYSYDSYGAVQLNPIIMQDTINIDRKLKFKAVNDVIKTNSKSIAFLNPTLNKQVFAPNSIAYLPKGFGDKFNLLKDSIYFYQDSILHQPKPAEVAPIIPKDGEPYEYTVRSGDVLGMIAQRHNVRVSQLQAWNNINGTRINIGDKIMIYGKKGKTVTPKKAVENKPKTKTTSTPKKVINNSGDYTNYTVKSGDNLWVIAKKYSGVSANNIMDFNKIDGNLSVGQVIKIPKP